MRTTENITTEGTEYTEGKYPYFEITGRIIKYAIDVRKALRRSLFDSPFFSAFCVFCGFNIFCGFSGCAEDKG